MSKALAAKTSKGEGTKQAQKHPAEVARQPVPTSPGGTVLAIQRSAGNHAVNQLLGHGFRTMPPTSGLLQRKCACGNNTIVGGECEECGKKQRLGLQTKLKVNEPGDIYEQEADRIADQVMAAPAHPAVSTAPPRIQRFSGQSNGQMDAAPTSVDRVLSSPGRPLEPALRQDMEQRFGYDFSRVRVHSDTAAEQSAREMNANAYTVGDNIVFGAGVFTPGTYLGRQLIAHELTHVVQQRGGGELRIQRSFAGCQTLLTNPGVVGLLSGIRVHSIIGQHFRQTVAGARGVAIPGAYASPLRTQGLCGEETKVIDPQEIGGMDPRAGAGIPDLARITPGGILQVAEVKPAAVPCLVDGEEQLLRYIDHGNAREEAQTAWRASLGVKVVSPMLESTYPPPSFSVAVPGVASAELRTAWCTPGLLAYTVKASGQQAPERVPEESPVFDAVRVLIILGMLGDAAKRAGLGDLLAGGGKKAFARAFIYAELATAVLLISTGKAEAKLGPGESSLETLAKAMEQEGTKMPPNLKALIEKDPELKALVDKAVSSGNGQAVNEELNKKISEIIDQNLDKFSREELKILLSATAASKQINPSADVTVEKLKKTIERIKAGETTKAGEGKSSGKGGGDVPSTVPESPTAEPPGKPAPSTLSDDLRKRLAADKAANAIMEELAVGRGGVKMDAAFVEELLAATKNAKPPLTEAEAAELAAVVKTKKGMTPAEILESVHKGIAERRPAAPYAPAGATPPGGGPMPTPPPTTPTPTTQIPFPSPGAMTEALGAAERVVAEKKAAAKAREFLKNPKLYDHILNDQIEGTFDVPKNVKVGAELSARVVGRANGTLFTGAVILVVTGPVTGSPDEWWATTKPAPMYRADGSKAMVLPSISFKARIVKGARAGAVVGATK
jgi:hypothetical protein